MSLSERRDARRLGAAVVAAILVHAGLFVAVPYLTSLDTSPLPDYGPVVVHVELPQAMLEPVPQPEPAPQPAAKPVATPAAKPAATPAAKPAVRTPAPAAAPAPAPPTRSPGTSSFRQAGAATGTSAGTADASIVSGPPPVTLPAVGTTTPGAGEQRSGEAVSLSSRPAGGTGTVDTRKLDQSLAGAGTAATSAGASGATTGAGTGKPASPSGSTIAWKNPDAAKGRTAIRVPDVAWPAWVKGSGEELTVRIEFSVNAEGLVFSAQVLESSGRGDLDKACREAMLKYGFTPAPGAAAIQGVAVFSTVLKR